MAHEFNFKEVFSKELKREIIERRAKKYVEKFGTPVKEAKRRARSEMMPQRKYIKFAKMAQAICEYFEIPTNSDYISISTNRYGQHSWYIDVRGVRVRISDHTTRDLSNVDIEVYPIGFYKYQYDNDTYKHFKGLDIKTYIGNIKVTLAENALRSKLEDQHGLEVSSLKGKLHDYLSRCINADQRIIKAQAALARVGVQMFAAKIRYENVIKFVSHDRKEVENYIEKDIKNEGLLDIELITSDSEYFVCY